MIRTRHYHAEHRSPFSRRYTRYTLHRQPRQSRHSIGPQILTWKRTCNNDVPRPSNTRWDLVTSRIDPVINDPPDQDEDMRSDGDIFGNVRGSVRRRKLSSTTATSGSILSDHM
jgi:hypothetical protein